MKRVLCFNRHYHPMIRNMPAVFGYISPSTNVEQLERIATEDICGGLEEEGGKRHLDLYATGYSPALCAVIKACIRCGVTLTVWHYNKWLDNYTPQEMPTCNVITRRD